MKNRSSHPDISFLNASLVGVRFLVFDIGRRGAVEAGMPNPPSSPTVVKVGIFLADIIDLDEVEETFQAEFIVVAEWEDPRLAFDPAVDGTDMKLFQGQFQFNEVFTGWWPQLLIVNEIGTGDINAITIEVHPDGRVRYMEQRNVTLETPMRLQPFPFDTQTLEAKMIAFGNYSEQVLLEVDERVLGATEEHVKGNERVNIAQWSLVNLDMVAGLADYRYYGAPKQLSEIRLQHHAGTPVGEYRLEGDRPADRPGSLDVGGLLDGSGQSVGSAECRIHRYSDHRGLPVPDRWRDAPNLLLHIYRYGVAVLVSGDVPGDR